MINLQEAFEDIFKPNLSNEQEEHKNKLDKVMSDLESGKYEDKLQHAGKHWLRKFKDKKLPEVEALANIARITFLSDNDLRNAPGLHTLNIWLMEYYIKYFSQNS